MKDCDDIVGIAGIHVDDSLIGGKDVFQQAITEMEQAYRCGKWEHQDFMFAGYQIRQDSSNNIYADQNVYSEKWVGEIELTPESCKQPKSPATPRDQSVAWRGWNVGMGIMSNKSPCPS